MSVTKPFFSVVMPTFNRAHLLPYALKSVLAQTWDDFEIVVSDGGSTDNTRDVVSGFDDPRIKYFGGSKRLTVGENYQNGLDHANGEFITFLSDDDAYTPRVLAKAQEIIARENAEIVGYRNCWYYHDDIYDFERNIPKNSLLIGKFDSKVTRFSSAEAIEQIYSMHALGTATLSSRFICPYLANAVYHRSIFDKLRTSKANLFDSVPPDMYLAIAVFFVSESYHCLDEPLLVWSNWEGNATATAQRTQNKIREHYERLLNGRELEFTPLKAALALNCSANAILEAVNVHQRYDLIVDWKEYFVKSHINLTYLRRFGIDTTKEMEEFHKVLSLQTPEIQRDVKNEISSFRYTAKRLLNSTVPGLVSFLRKLRAISQNQVDLTKGSNGGFGNVFEAARHVN